MILNAPARVTTGVWDETLGCFVDEPEPITHWIQRSMTAMHMTASSRSDIIDPVMKINLDVRRELLKEILTVPTTGMPSFIYGCLVEVDPTLEVPFQLTWKTREELAAESAMRGLHRLLGRGSSL